MLDLAPIKAQFGVALDGQRLWDATRGAAHTTLLLKEVETLRMMLAQAIDHQPPNRVMRKAVGVATTKELDEMIDEQAEAGRLLIDQKRQVVGV